MNTEFEKILKETENLENLIKMLITGYRTKKDKPIAEYEGDEEDFYEDRLDIIGSFNTLEMDIRETFGFFPSSMTDLMKLRDEFKKLKTKMDKEKIYEFREHAFSFFDRITKALQTKDPIAILVKETNYEDIKKTFTISMNKLSKEATVMSALSYMCSDRRYVSAKKIASVLGVNIKTAQKVINTISHNLWQFVEYNADGKETEIKAKNLLIQLYKEAGQNAV